MIVGQKLFLFCMIYAKYLNIELSYQSYCHHSYTCICTTLKGKITLEPVTNIIGKRNIELVPVVSID